MNHNANQSDIFNLDENVAATLAAAIPLALTFIGHMSYIAWAVPLVIFFWEKKSEFVRLCAAQSLALNAAMVLCSVVTRLLNGVVSGAGLLWLFPVGAIGLILSIVQLACLVILLMTAIKAYKMEIFEIPTITDWIKKNIKYNGN